MPTDDQFQHLENKVNDIADRQIRHTAMLDVHALRIGRIEQGVEHILGKLEQHDERFDRIDEQLGAIDEKLDRLIEREDN